VALTDDALAELLDDTAEAVRDALGGLADWGLIGAAAAHAGQHHSDLAADAAALAVLRRAEVGVLSEESGAHDLNREIVVVIDPLDGSTNAARGIPWYAISLCAVDPAGPRAALVVDLPHGRRFTATRGAGAFVDGRALRPSGVTELGEAVVGITGLPSRPLGWRQFRALGAAALDMCAVAEGVTDGFVDCLPPLHGPWDYLGALLVCREAGVPVGDAYGDELVVLDHAARRTPVAAATPALFEQLMSARRTLGVR
jgi:fructose-1,6-bisphosphatase/inositol monophosphatase family enzyme